MTIPSMPALQRTTAHREAIRAGLAAAACMAGGALLVFAETSSGPVGPLSAFQVPAAAVAPTAWGLDRSSWTGLAGAAVNLGGTASWALRIVAVLLISAAALAVIHPGVFERPAPYYLPPVRRAIAWITALLIGMALPATLLLLTPALTHEPAAGIVAMDSTVTLRIMLGVSIFCAILWALAGRGVLNPRALIRFTHGGMAGIGIFGALGIAAVATRPLIELAALSRAGNVFSAADAGAGAPGATFGWMLGATMLLYGLGCAVAGAVAVTGCPQSIGSQPRLGPALVASAALVLLLVSAAAMDRGADGRAADAAPDLVTELSLDTTTAPRPILLLLGDRESTRVPPRAAMTPVDLAGDCSPPRMDADRALPAATAENAAKLAAFRERLGNEVSGRAARALNCEAAIRARLFEPDEARRLIFTDPERARVGYAGFRAGVRGLLEHVSSPRSRSLLAQLADTSRYRTTPQIRERLAALTRGHSESLATVTGRLSTGNPPAWRIGVVAAGDSALGITAWSTAPRTDGLIMEWMAAAVTPDANGLFSFTDLAPGRYRLALLAPAGTSPDSLRRSVVDGDPGAFQLRAGERRALGIISIQ